MRIQHEAIAEEMREGGGEEEKRPYPSNKSKERHFILWYIFLLYMKAAALMKKLNSKLSRGRSVP